MVMILAITLMTVTSAVRMDVSWRNSKKKLYRKLTVVQTIVKMDTLAQALLANAALL